MKVAELLRPAALTLALAIIAPVAQAGDGPVEKCLAASFYPDSSELMAKCETAIKQSGVPDAVMAQVNLQMGQAIYFSHRPGIAIGFLNTAIALDPELAQAYRRRGWSFLMSGFGRQAMSDFTEYLALAPDDPDAKFAMVFARDSLGQDCVKSAGEYQQILRQHPQHHITRYNLALGYHCIDGNRKRQIVEYDRIIAAGRDEIKDIAYYSRRDAAGFDFYAMVRETRAAAYQDMGDTSAALEDANWLKENYPESYDGYLLSALSLLHSGKDSEVLMNAEKALSISPRLPDAQYVKAVILMRTKHDKELVEYATSVMTSGVVNPHLPFIVYARGVANKRLGNRDQAILDFNAAMLADDDSVRMVHTQLVQSGYMYGKDSEAGGARSPDFRSPEFINALAACTIDPECMNS